MYRALYTAASGMETQQINLENVANNLANANTTGFRRRRLQFQDLIYQNLVLPGAASTQQTTFPTGLQIGLGTRLAASASVQLQGDINTTGNTLDLCIQGQGFFQVQLPSGEVAYTRDGSFSLDPTGILVTSDGYQLQPAITIPPSATNVTIGTDGTVSVQLPGQQQAQQVGTIQLATFANPGGLSSVGQNLFLETTASGNPIVGTPGGSEGLGTILQGSLENSNVDIVTEFVNMILAQRSYEANSRVVQAANEMFQTINSLTTT
jgi:flagellar basal-body rod protein FlgG